MERKEAIAVLECLELEMNAILAGIPKSEATADQIKRCIDAYDMAISALRQQEHFRDLTKKVEPLTLDELRKMDGEPVWVVWPDLRIHSQWFIVGSVFWIEMFVEDDGTLLSGYGNRWLAYRQMPEEGTV